MAEKNIKVTQVFIYRFRLVKGTFWEFNLLKILKSLSFLF